MNVNSILIELENITGLPVEEDRYDGTENEWITFTYADENYADYGDNQPISEECDIQLKVTLLKTTDYFELKEKIKEYLLQKEAYGVRSQAYLDSTDEKQKYRILQISCKFKEEKGE